LYENRKPLRAKTSTKKDVQASPQSGQATNSFHTTTQENIEM